MHEPSLLMAEGGGKEREKGKLGKKDKRRQIQGKRLKYTYIYMSHGDFCNFFAIM